MLKNTLKAFVLLIICSACNQSKKNLSAVNYKVHTFYYNWYANPKIDGEYSHWNHDILPHWSDTTWNNAGNFTGGDDIGANYYPALGNYSSNNPAVINKHMKLIKQAGIGVVAITWWGKDSFEDKSITTYLDIAQQYNLKLAIHIEPFYTSVEELKQQLVYLHEQYATHPAFYKFKEKPFYYVYDSYKIAANQWSKLLNPNGEISIRNTPLDGTFIGLWVHKNEQDFFINGGFDGFYTYFASNGFVYGSTTTNWPQLAAIAKQNKLLFIPCVGPGYIDTRIRPWNAKNTKARNKGKYYENMFNSALAVQPHFIGITSFNEWHEGTQIEPAIPKLVNNYTYEDYEGKDSLFYINKTKQLIQKFTD